MIFSSSAGEIGIEQVNVSGEERWKSLVNKWKWYYRQGGIGMSWISKFTGLFKRLFSSTPEEDVREVPVRRVSGE